MNPPRAQSATLTPDDFAAAAPLRTIRSEGEAANSVLAPGSALEDGYTVLQTLGQGGSAIVRLATQHSLGREVAIKSPVGGITSAAALQRVLQEGWVTGALDHPGVVPVHDIATDANGCPHIVMRRVEGLTWSELLADDTEVRNRFSVHDIEEWHLRVLMSVAATVHHAHGRGVIHRDLKPDNVMVGPAGETILLDWGIAVAIDPERVPFLPAAADQHRIAGTPRFMAPELAAGDGAAQGVTTDVYLLGGLLHAILTGDGPHPGSDARRVIALVPEFEFRATPDKPAQLQAIAAKALALAPADRQQSADEFRLNIQHYLENRSAAALYRAGQLEAELLVSSIAENTDPEKIIRHYASARASFDHALASASGSVDAAAGLAQTQAHFVEWQLSRGEAEAARAVLGEMASAPETLVRAVSAALDVQHREREAARRLLHDHDQTARVRTRAYVSLLLGLFFTLAPAFAAAFRPEPTYLELHTATGTLLLLVLVLWWWARDSLERTSLNRLFIRTAAIAPLAQMTLMLGLWRMDIPSASAVHFFPLTSAALTAVLAAAEAPWFFVATVGYAVAFVVSAGIPGLRWPLHTLANLLVAAVALAQWGPPAIRSWRRPRRHDRA